jgi:2,3-dihydroxybenzoate decarboxylase
MSELTGLTRRALLGSAACLTAALGTATFGRAARAVSGATRRDFKRIATEEAFNTKEVFGGYLELLAEHPETEPGFAHFWETALGTPGDLVANLSSVLGGEGAADVVELISQAAAAMGSDASVTALARLFDLGEDRIRIMDEAGVAMQIISLASPGVQVFDAEKGTALARRANDQLAAAARAHPTRFAGLAAIAPQSVDAATRELERAVRELGLNGVMINSHTKGEYLDEEKFRPILAKVEELRVPLYIHPRTPSPQMLEPFTRYPGLAAATYGFSVETGLHALRLILGGVFDDFPGLTVILGHMGEGLPFWIDRVDNRTAFIQTGPGPKSRKLRKRPSDYLRENFYVTTSGMDFEPALMLAHRVVGPERILFAIDHPMEDGTNPVRVLDEAPIPDEDKIRIYQTNAERVFRVAVS